MKKLRRIPEILAVGAFVLVGALAFTMPKTVEVQLNDEVNAKSVTKIVQSYLDMPGRGDPLKTFVLTINSPGGEVYQEEYLVNMLTHSNANIVTEVPNFAASAATSIFLAGKIRLMSEDAVLIFHEVRIFVAGHILTFTDLKNLLNDDFFSDPNSANFLDFKLAKFIKALIGKDLKDVVKSLEKTHERHIAFLMSRTGLSRDVIEKEVIIHNVDKEIHLKDALRLNIATGVL